MTHPGLPERALFSPFALKAVQAGGVFDGYASVFGRIDQGRDMVMRGAFAASLRERGPAGVKMLWQHDPNQPIGVYDEIREDARGLYVRGRLLLDVQKAREAQALLQAGAIDGLSIGYRVVKSAVDEASGLRRLEEVDLWEISLVTFPMQAEARVAVKRRPGSVREFEAFLREAGFSRAEAKAIAAQGFQRRDAGWAETVAAIRDVTRRVAAF